MIVRHITDALVGQLAWITYPDGRIDRLAVIEDVGEEPDDEIRVVYCTTGSVDWIEAHHLVPVGRAAHPDDFSASALAAIHLRNHH